MILVWNISFFADMKGKINPGNFNANPSDFNQNHLLIEEFLITTITHMEWHMECPL